MKTVALKLLCSCLATVASATAAATFTIDPPEPYRRVENSIYFPKQGNGGTLDPDIKSFDVTDSTSQAALIPIHVRSDENVSIPGGELLYLWVFVETAGGDLIAVPIQGASYSETDSPTLCASTSICDGVKPYIVYPKQQTITIGLHPETICALVDAEGEEADGCVAELLENRADTTANDAIKIQIAIDTTATPETPVAIGSMEDSSALTTLYFVGDAPNDVSCPSSADGFYFPGDRQIIFERLPYGESTSTSGVREDQILLLADTGVVDTTNWNDNDLVFTLTRGESSVRLEGFTNDTDYNVAVMLRNAALIGSNLPDTCGYTVRSTEIFGVLERGNCFIATGVFRDPEHPFLGPLRQFRNRVLKRSSYGRALIHFYGHHGPRLAKWILERPEIGNLLQVPIGIFSFWSYVLTSLSTAWEAEASYSETLRAHLEKKNRDKEQPKDPSYTEVLRQEIESEPSSPSNGYTKALKERVLSRDNEGSESEHRGYTEELRDGLKKEEEDQRSYSERIQKGEVELKARIDEEVDFFFGLNFGAFSSRTFSGTLLRESFENVYGDGFVPEFNILGEWQPFHSEWIGSIGFLFQTGFTFKGAPGRFGTPVPGFPAESQTRFKFVTVPAVVGVSVRWNTLRFIRPFATASVGALGVLEAREDAQKNKRAILAQWIASAGVNLRLDDFSKRARWEIYDSSGIKHTYLSAEARFERSFGGVLAVQNLGVYVGLGFEI